MEKKNSLEFGQAFENTVAAWFVSEGGKVTSTQDKGKFSDYDMYVGVDDGGFTAEIKFDLQAHDSKNIAVERFKKGYNGESLNGGLSATKADYYVQGCLFMKEVYIIPTATLKKLVENYELKTEGGDDNCKYSLIPLKDFRQHAEILFERIPEKKVPDLNKLRQMAQEAFNKTKK
jgi:hypothetical protein